MLKNIRNNYYYGNDILERIREVRWKLKTHRNVKNWNICYSKRLIIWGRNRKVNAHV